jgi:hypothetical protein
MTKFVFRIAVPVLLLTMLTLLGVIGWQMPESVAQRAKQQAVQAEQAKKQQEFAKAKEMADAALLERRRKSPEYRKELALLAINKQFPGECSAEAEFAVRSNGDVLVRCKYDEMFLAGSVGAGFLAMRLGVK